MGIQLDNVTTASDSSLTWIVDDLLGGGPAMASRCEAAPAPALDASGLEAWVNALLRQATPIVTSRAGRAQLEAWLAAVEPADV